MVQTARCSVIFKSTAQIFTSGTQVTCVATFFGRSITRSMGTCNHQWLPCRTSCGLCVSHPFGSGRPEIRTLIQLQDWPVQSLSRTVVPVCSFHIPAYRMVDLFHLRGGTGGRSVHFFPFASACSLCLRHLARWVEKDRAEPRAALMAARRNIAGTFWARAESGRRECGCSLVTWVRCSKALSASLLERFSTSGCAWMTST